MKKLSKPIVAILLVVSLVLSAAIVSFAGDDGDPGGHKCIYIPIVQR